VHRGSLFWYVKLCSRNSKLRKPQHMGPIEVLFCEDGDIANSSVIFGRRDGLASTSPRRKQRHGQYMSLFWTAQTCVLVCCCFQAIGKSC